MAFAPLPSAPVWKYDMFLSFSGKDTRKGIVSTLYHELKKLSNFNPFMDSQELKPGAEISSDLLTAIQESKSVIIFLSPNYDSSAWCLDELEIIVQCLETRNTKVIPLFYNVDPSDVRHQLRTFAEAFTRHEHRYSQEDGIQKVKRWRTALTKVANLSGLESSKFE
ncbi:PREDICTED: TMV resistance protein N-like [Fragaria vesca subsp. vesca]